MTVIFEINPEDFASRQKTKAKSKTKTQSQPKPKISQSQRRGRLPDGSPNLIDRYIGQRLRLLREAHNVTQISLAKSISVSYQQIQKYECGEGRICANRLFDFAAFFGVEIEYFFQGIPLAVALMSPSCLNNEDFKAYVKQEKKGFTNDEIELIAYFRKIKETGCMNDVTKLIYHVTKFVKETSTMLAY